MRAFEGRHIKDENCRGWTAKGALTLHLGHHDDGEFEIFAESALSSTWQVRVL